MRVLAFLLALTFGTSQALAGGLLNSFFAGPAAPTLSFEACTADTSNTTEYTFSGHDVGTAAANRHTIITAVSADEASAFNFNSITVGGDAATEIIDQAETGTVTSAIYIVANTTGTAEDIVVTMSENVTSVVICVYAAYGLTSATATDTATDEDTGGAAMDVSLNVSSGGLAVAIAFNSAVDWTGLTEDDEVSTGEGTYSAASGSGLAAETPRSVTTTTTVIAAAASFR